VLTAWGRLRSWICSGHFTRGLELNELIESLAGLPFDVEFISFEDLLQHGVPGGVQVIINCGRAGSAWSGGRYWADPGISALLTRWVQKGGGFIGVAEPSAMPGPGQLFKLSHVLGLDRDRGERIANGKYQYAAPAPHFITANLAGAPDFGKDLSDLYVLSAGTRVLAEQDGSPCIATHAFGRGRSVYLSGFKFTYENTRLLHRALFWAAAQEKQFPVWNCSNLRTESAYFPRKGKLVVINNAGTPQKTVVTLGNGRSRKTVRLAAHGIKILDL
jgi:beta-D-galactosyl-(1->4)-L-rhamnose phosphorylase